MGFSNMFSCTAPPALYCIRKHLHGEKIKKGRRNHKRGLNKALKKIFIKYKQFKCKVQENEEEFTVHQEQMEVVYQT